MPHIVSSIINITVVHLPQLMNWSWYKITYSQYFIHISLVFSSVDVFMWSRIQWSLPHYFKYSYLLRLVLLCCDSFSGCLCFWWIWQFSGILVRYFVEYFWLELVRCFSYMKTVVMCFGEGDHRGECHSPDIIPRAYAIWTNFKTVEVNLDHLAEIVFLRFLYYKVTLLLYIVHALKGSHYTQLTLKSSRVILHLHKV